MQTEDNTSYDTFFSELSAIHPIGQAFTESMTQRIEAWPVLENDIIIRQGQRVTHYFSLRAGFAMGYGINANNEREVRRFWMPGNRIMPGNEPLGESFAEENIVAVSAGKLYALSLADLADLCREFAEARYFLGHFQGEEIALLNRRIRELTTLGAQARLNNFRLRYPPEFFTYLRSKDLLASYLNMARQTLSQLDMPPLEVLKRR